MVEKKSVHFFANIQATYRHSLFVLGVVIYKVLKFALVVTIDMIKKKCLKHSLKYFDQPITKLDPNNKLIDYMLQSYKCLENFFFLNSVTIKMSNGNQIIIIKKLQLFLERDFQTELCNPALMIKKDSTILNA